MTAPTTTRSPAGERRRAVGAAAAQRRKRDALIEDYEWLIEADPRLHDEMAAARLGVTIRTIDRIRAAIKYRDQQAASVTR